MSTVISARDVETAANRGQTQVVVQSGAVVTPAARDRARELGVQLVSPGEVRPPAPPPPPRAQTNAALEGAIHGRVVGSPEVRAAHQAGLKRIAITPGAYVTRAAQHLAHELGIALLTGGPYADARPVNPLASGGGVTRDGPGVVHEGGLPIGGDHLPGTLPPLPKAGEGGLPRPLGEALSRGERAPNNVDPVVLDLVENALKNIRAEMDAVLLRTAMSPGIREQHDFFPMVADPEGKMVVGQFGSFIPGFLAGYSGEYTDGDVFLLNDPYACEGAISHLNDWLVLLPIYYAGELTGWASMFGHMSDVGGSVPGSMPIGARSIHAEGVIIRPFKLFAAGVLNTAAFEQILSQVRLPDWNRSDTMGLVAACRLAARRIGEVCERFGRDTYLMCPAALLKRTRTAVAQLIERNVPESPEPPLTFADYVDDDGRGNGPYRIECTVWREGPKAIFDWSGTDPQSPAAINFFLNPEMLKMFIGVYFIMVLDPQILFNDGYYDLIEVRIPEGSLLRPTYPAALSGRTHALGRVFDIFGGALGQRTPELMTAAGFSDSPHLFYSGTDATGAWFQLYQIGFGGVPGRPAGDGLDGHSLWPEFTNVPSEYLENYYPMRVEKYAVVPDSGGAGRHRGGNGMEVVYHLLEPGTIAIHDDRWLTHPWGVLGGRPGGRSRKVLVKADGQHVVLPSKTDDVAVEQGDRLHYVTWGGGGWGDPLERDPELVARDVRRKLVSREKAEAQYGIIIDGSGMVDRHATERHRRSLRTRHPAQREVFDFGAPVSELLERCAQDTGLPPPKPPGARV